MTKVIGDNGGLSDGVFWQHYNAWQNLNKRKSGLANDYKKLRKVAKDDGVDIGDFKDLEALRATPLAEQIEKHNRMIRMLRFLKQPIGEHLQIIDPTLSDETGLTDEQRQEKWENIGYVAGRSAADRVETMKGHDPNSDTGRWITAGYERGQAENAKGIKKPPVAPKAAEKPAETQQSPATPPAGPKDEPEVAAAKARGKKGGVTYWHNAELRKVYEVKISDADPAGAKPITKKEYEKLQADYAQADAQAWEGSAPAEGTEPPAPADGDDGFDTPPDPDAA